MSWKRADGLAELCRGMFDPGSDEVDSWSIIKEAFFAIKTDLIKAEGTLDELHKASWARVDKSYGAFCEVMERRNDQDASDKAEPALLKGPAYAAFAGVLFGANDRPSPVIDQPSRRKASWQVAGARIPAAADRLSPWFPSRRG